MLQISRFTIWAAVVVTLWATAGVACAQSEQGTITVPEAIKLSRLLDLTSQALGTQYSYNPADLDASVTLRVSRPLTPSQLEHLTFQVLASKGMAVVRVPGSPVLTVVKLDQAAGAATLTPQVAGMEGGAGFVTEVISPKHQTPKALIEAIKPLLSRPAGAATVLGDSSLVALSDFASRITEIKTVIERIDIPDVLVTKLIPVKYIGGTQLAASIALISAKRELAGGRKLLGDVIAPPDGSGVLLICPPQAEAAWRELIAELDRREPAQTQTYAPRYFAAKDVSKLVESVGNPPGSTSTDERFRVVVDDLTSSLIITATPTQHERVKALLDRLDNADRSPMPVRSFPIRNRPVGEIIETLQQLVAAGILEADSAGTAGAARSEVTAGSSQTSLRSPLLPGGNTSTQTPVVIPPTNSTRTTFGGTPATGSNARPPLSMTADEATNTLIAIGEPRMLSQLESLLVKLDVRQPQVMLEVTLVSLTKSDTLNLGVELERIGSVDNAFVRLSSLFGLSGGVPGARVVGDAAGFTGVVLDPGEFSVVVRALEAVNKGRSMSNPKVLVTNNERALFSSTIQQPVQQQTRTGSNDTTFSYGGTENAGTTISVKPQIAQGDHLVLTYSIKLSSFIGSSTTAGLPPPKQENSVDSVATIPDGHTIVVGGLDLVSDAKGESRVPFVGELPLIGDLFKTRSNSDSHTKFFVFIKATVLRSGSFEDLKYLSSSDAARAKINDGFPDVTPRVIK